MNINDLAEQGFFEYIIVLFILYEVINALFDSLISGIKEFNKKEKGVAKPAEYIITRQFFDYIDYDISKDKLRHYLELYVNNKYDPHIEESFLLYLLILLANHKDYSYFETYFNSLYSMALTKYNICFSIDDLARYRIGACFKDNILNVNIMMANIDCIDYQEYCMLLRYIKFLFNNSNINRMSINEACKLCLLCNFVVNSRFTRGNQAYSIFFSELFVYYYQVIRGREEKLSLPNLGSSYINTTCLKFLKKGHTRKLVDWCKKNKIKISIMLYNHISLRQLNIILALSKKEREQYLINIGWHVSCTDNKENTKASSVKHKSIKDSTDTKINTDAIGLSKEEYDFLNE